MPPKVSRTRNRKINFKTRIPIRTGVLDVVDEEADYGNEGSGLFDADSQDKDRMRVETGVDKEEEGEVHLQNVISASTATYTARSSSRGGPGPTSKPAAAYIPTPDATGQVVGWERLYKPRPSAEPVTYIRFSDTVEDTSGVGYNMDEEDDEWLQACNRSIIANAESNKLANLQQQQDRETARGTRQSPKKDKGKEVLPTSPLSELDFEMIMDHFEKVTEERLPLLHLDMSRCPTFSDFDPTFAASEYSRLSSLKLFARIVYSHWKERRIKRGGLIITPQLDYDETREDHPYVCFRRRELKNVRKTRRTDTQNYEKLARLSTDLQAARELLLQVLERERLKKEDLLAERQVFENRVQVRDLKRRLGERDGDEELLIGKREKRRRTVVEESLSASTNSLKVPLRIPRPDAAFTVPATPAVAEPIQPYKDRTAAINARIEKDLLKKREADREWEDFTDGAYLPQPLLGPARFWRSPETIPVLAPDGHKSEVWAFAQPYLHAIGGVQPSFRRRIGRGGRALLDRTTSASRHSSTEDPERRARIDAMWKFDTDAADLPGHNSLQILDDFAPQYMNYRLDLLKGGDVDSWLPSTLYLEDAKKWINREPDKLPPTTVVGKLPVKAMPQPPPPMVLQQQQQAQINAQAQAQAQAHASQMQAQGQTPQSAAVVSQMMAAASHAQQVAQTHSIARNSPPAPLSTPLPNGASASVRQSPQSSQLATNGFPLPNGGQWAGNVAAMKGLLGQKLDPAALQIHMQLAQQYQQQNGMTPNGVNRQQQYMNQAAMQIAQAQQQQQMNNTNSPILHPVNGVPARMNTPSFGLPPVTSSPLLLARANSISSQNSGSPSMLPALLPGVASPSRSNSVNESTNRSPTKRSPRLQNQPATPSAGVGLNSFSMPFQPTTAQQEA